MKTCQVNDEKKKKPDNLPLFLLDPALSLKAPDFLEALYDYSSTNLVMSNGDKDLSFQKGDLMTFLENCPNDWLRVERKGVKGVIPKSFVRKVMSSETKEEKVRKIILTLCKSLDSDEKVAKVDENYWKFIPKVTIENRDVSREVNRLFFF